MAGRENGFSEKKCRRLAVAASRSYRKSMERFAQARTLDLWYYHVEADAVPKVFEKYTKAGAKSARKTLAKARTKTREQTLEKLTEMVDGRRRIINAPPLLVRLSDMLSEEQKGQVTEQDVENAWLAYIDSLPEERRLLLSRFRIADGALRVGGVGSVGTLCTILLLEGGAQDDALILQQKEAGPSVLEPYLAKRDYASPAQRVVTNQRLMQASSDIFLGRNHGVVTGPQYYWRQLKDMKGSFDVAASDEAGMETYLAVCTVCLARAQARTGDAAGIWGYLDESEAFDEAIGDFAVAYADQTERDHQAQVEAVRSGRIAAETGI